MYDEHVLEHAKKPYGRGSLENASVEFHDTNPLCGDEVTIYLEIKDGVIVNALHEAKGCAVSQAGTSMLFEELKGKKVKEIISKPKEEILEQFGVELSVSRVKCALLGLIATKKAIMKYSGEIYDAEN